MTACPQPSNWRLPSELPITSNGDRAFRELDAVTSERNQFKVEIERLKRQIAILASSRMHYAPSIGST